MDQWVLLGDEAIAQGAIDAGLTCIYAYPGTPSTEINEYVERSREARERQIKACWCANEKTAMETAIGVSYTGKRGMACMKHVGLNVAADPFINSAITGANGGLLVVSADDPSMHSSQNEQDSRFYGKFAMVPILEPGNQQEAYDMTYEGFNLSERLKLPVLIRITTRLAHSRAVVKRSHPVVEQNPIRLPDNPLQYILLPVSARKRYKELLGKQEQVIREAEESRFNQWIDGTDRSLGIIAAGIAYNYLIENYNDRKCPHPVVKIGHYPMPRTLIEKLYDSCDQILVLEDGYPFIEELLRGYLNHGKKIMGRMDGTCPLDGELNPAKVATALGFAVHTGMPVPGVVISRPPSLCKGCPHIFSFNALNEAVSSFPKGRVFSDIGCYSLGALAPYQAINSLVDMGASITMAKGAADAGLIPSIAVIGDSTFIHSGITGLVDAVNNRSPITLIILDNQTTAMTGGQPSLASPRIETICEGAGVEKEHIHIVNPIPKNHGINLDIIRQELEYHGVSVIIPRRECIQTASRKLKQARSEKPVKEEIA
ncbi:MAG: thiamine pyrophosphate-dependent enzyme [Bacteroidales bacterium]|nr:indolepyruvate ferredoxin oxidoreductase [Lentimicrobiaceae bacterium]MDD5694276.1 thiamine pyrophosphate-dependent enzyme [Bacteroidales bacterium]